MEHFRNKTHQFCDAVRYVIIDTHTGKLEGFTKDGGSVGNYDEMRAFMLRLNPGLLMPCTSRHIAVKMDSVVGFPLENRAKMQKKRENAPKS